VFSGFGWNAASTTMLKAACRVFAIARTGCGHAIESTREQGRNPSLSVSGLISDSL